MPYSFIGRRLLNASVKFICFANITSDAEVVISTPNIFAQEWGTYPTMIYLNVYNFTRRAYIPITTQKGSFCDAITSVFELIGLRENESIFRIIVLESVKTSVMTFLLIMLLPLLIMPWVMSRLPRPMI